MNIELKKIMDEKRLLDKEIDKLEEEIFHACENNQFDKAAALKETYKDVYELKILDSDIFWQDTDYLIIQL